MKTGRDIKFVIYQILYIFVICVIALKGADIDLQSVTNIKDAEPKEVADKLRKQIDSIMKLIPDSIFSVDSTKIYTQAYMDKILAMLKNQPTDQEPGSTKKENIGDKGPGFTTNIEDPNIPKGELNTKDPIVPEFTQYTVSKVTNQYDKVLEIYGDGKKLATIQPKTSGEVKVNGETNIKYEVNGRSGSKPTKQNLAPKVSMERYVTMGEDASVSQMQNKVGYRITITDDILSNLDINISGTGLKVDKVANNIYDVTLKMFGNESAFDAWSKNKTSPYRVSFNVNVRDKYNPNHKLAQVGIFTFGKW